jgi:poly(A) polymerase
MSIALELIDPDAEKVIRRLRRYGHTAYLVGGCVRDLLLGRTPKDFDIATSATPNEIKLLFRNCRIIGRRFRLAHVFFGSKIIETSTFRQNPREGAPVEEAEELLIRRDNVFGSEEDDARRRDFTINGLFYDLEAGRVIDHVEGLKDLEARLVRTIGDPDIRFREDPIRILRAIKFAARLGFAIEPVTYDALLRHRGEIPKCAPPRLLEEIYRLLRGGAAKPSFELLLQTGVCEMLAPELARRYGGEVPPSLPGIATGDAAAPRPDASVRRHAWRVLEELDHLSVSGTPTNAVLIAALACPFLPEEAQIDGGRARELLVQIDDALGPVALQLKVSRRDAERARQILLSQRRLAPSKRRKPRPMSMVRRDYFGEALAVYTLAARAKGEVGEEIAAWHKMWRQAQALGHSGALDEAPDDALAPEPAADEHASPLPAPRRRRRRGGRRRRHGDRPVLLDLPAGTEGALAQGEPEAATASTEAPSEVTVLRSSREAGE